MRQKKLIISFLLVMLLYLSGCQQDVPVLLTEEESAKLTESVSDTDDPSVKEQQIPENICVYVCGAVHLSGVYTLPEGSRVYEAIAAAGGLREDADEQYVNQAQILSDGMQITVPVKRDPSVAAEPSGVEPDGRVNLNRATAEELQKLNGIGEVKAAAILAYREAHGGFSSTEEITKVDGISEKLYEKIKEHIVV